jgi:hypothetical protein
VDLSCFFLGFEANSNIEELFAQDLNLYFTKVPSGVKTLTLLVKKKSPQKERVLARLID